MDVTGTAAVRRRPAGIDWRFLLPDPNPAVTICFAGGALADAARALFPHFVDGRSHHANADGDLAIAADPDAETLRLAIAALRPAGACYVEFHARSATPSEVRRRLEAAGFRDVSLYAPRPASPPHSMWIPVDAAGALHHVLGLPSADRRFRSRVRRVLRRLPWLGRWRLRKLRPICAVARAPGSAAHDRAEALEDELLRTWDDWGVGARPRRLSTVLLTPGFRPENKVVRLVFAEPCRIPSLVLKMPRVPEAVASLRREAEVLDALTTRYGRLPGVPAVLVRRFSGDIPVIGQSFLRGSPVASRPIHGSGYRTIALRVTEWLSELARATAEPCDAGWWQRLVEPVLVEFDACFRRYVGDAAIDQTAALVRRIALPHLVAVHDDLTPDNVLITRSGAVNVVDFEFGELRALPGTDLVAFLARLACRRDGAVTPDQREVCYGASGDPLSETGRVWRECAHRYAQRVGLSPPTLGPLALVTWMSGASAEFRRLSPELAQPSGEHDVRPIRYLRFWREELKLLAEGRSALAGAARRTP